MLRDELNHQDAEHERGQCVERVVAVDKALQEGDGRRSVGRCRRVGCAWRCDQRFNDEDDDRGQQYGRQDSADASDQFLGVDGEPEGDEEEDDKEDDLRPIARVGREEGADGNLEREGARAGDGEGGADGEVERQREEYAEEWVYAASQFLHIAAARVAHRQDAGQGQPDAGKDEARYGPPHVCSRPLT